MGAPRHRVATALALLLAVALTAAACGSEVTVADIEGELRQDIAERTAERGVEVRDVDCPDDADVAEGAAFDCDVPAIEAGQRVVYTARVTIGEGSRVSWELTDVRPAGD